ncbi:MAG TPA: Ldh family oxidoreductase, partial [Thermomicrobiales bacterium]|nr:Ldh family oxidoreductase [Thermomicrobiales bacterium]
PFVPLETFEAEVEAQCDLIASCPPGEGYDCVLLPGDPEIANRQQREAEGIPVPERTWSELLALAEELGVSVATT